jgi:hypothetical protein
MNMKIYEIRLIGTDNILYTVWFNANNPIGLTTNCGSVPTITPTPVATVTPVATSTPTPTPTPAITATLTPQGMIDDLAQNYGVFLEDLTTTNYWQDPSYSNRTVYNDRIQAIHAVVTHYGTTIFASLGGTPGQNFQAVFGPRTVFRYTGIAQLYAAEVKLTQRTENVIELYNLSNVRDKINLGCGSIDQKEPTKPGEQVFAGYNYLDITRCTIAHELGHVIVARAARGTNFAGNYEGFGSTTCNGIGRFDPGQDGWPWREHPIRGNGTYEQNLCNTEASIVIREFEADMIMNYVLLSFDLTNSEHKKRFLWTEARLIIGDKQGPAWLLNAVKFTKVN